jgi:hypothetical protein
MIYHALNRANFRSRLFRETAHYEDFLDIVEEPGKWFLTPFSDTIFPLTIFPLGRGSGRAGPHSH